MTNTSIPRPRLTVVGAGIGDPDLITIKAVKALQLADVVLYDALVNESLFEYIRPEAVRVYVGKRRQHKAFSQDEINQLIVGYARDYGHVVRLKGGDPFVFGRGHEEMQYAAGQGVAIDYIPGISSAIAGAGAAGIPVTLRGSSRSFWVLTATTDTGDLNPEIQEAAGTNATVVILMGLAKIQEITTIFEKSGKPDLPVAVIQNATLPTQKTIFGTVKDIVTRSKETGAGTPAILVFGEVVNAATLLTPYDAVSIPHTSYFIPHTSIQ